MMSAVRLNWSCLHDGHISAGKVWLDYAERSDVKTAFESINSQRSYAKTEPKDLLPDAVTNDSW